MTQFGRPKDITNNNNRQLINKDKKDSRDGILF